VPYGDYFNCTRKGANGRGSGNSDEVEKEGSARERGEKKPTPTPTQKKTNSEKRGEGRQRKKGWPKNKTWKKEKDGGGDCRNFNSTLGRGEYPSKSKLFEQREISQSSPSKRYKKSLGGGVGEHLREKQALK